MWWDLMKIFRAYKFAKQIWYISLRLRKSYPIKIKVIWNKNSAIYFVHLSMVTCVCFKELLILNMIYKVQYFFFT